MTKRGAALEFFAGIGLARMGLEREGWQVAFSNDFDTKKAAMHVGHFGLDPRYVVADIFDLRHDQLPIAELAWASFPCVDLSLAGNRAGLNGSSSSAFWGFAKLLQTTAPDDRPDFVVLENVLGMLSSRGGSDLRKIIEVLNTLDYVADVVQIDASGFVPQSRPRLFVIGARTDSARQSATSVECSWLRPKRIYDFSKQHADLNLRAFTTPPQPSSTLPFTDIAEQFPDESSIWWSEDANRKLIGQMSPRHLLEVQRLTEREIVTRLTVYKRVRHSGCMAEVRFDGIAGCLRTPRGGSSRQFVLEVGRGRVRSRHMTAVEYGRLQGAADYKIRVPEMQALFGFGDAVCVDVVSWLARNLIEPLRDCS